MAALAADAARSAADLAALAERLTRAHRQYAKRQRTWFRGSGMAGLAVTMLDPEGGDTVGRVRALLDAGEHRGPEA
ncbi:MAG: hypothetical protein U1F43_38240 [Myxococcota bacterium]